MKIVKRYNCFSKVLYLRSLAEFLKCSFLSKHLSTCRVTLHCALYRDIQSPFYFHKFRHIQANSLSIEAFLEHEIYSEIRIECCITLVYWELCYKSGLVDEGIRAWLGFGTQPRSHAPRDLWVEISKMQWWTSG